MTLEKPLKNFIAKYTNNELTTICKTLNKEYNIYDPEDVRWEKIAYAFFRSSSKEIDILSMSMSSNKVINDLLLTYYICERVVKYFFIQKLKTLVDNIVAFEMTVGDSRIDICRINGGTYAYEIKTEYDTFERLDNQINNYIRAFEKVYIIVPKARVPEAELFISSTCGIISYCANRFGDLVFSYHRKAKKNNCDINFCIESLSSDEMGRLLRILHQKIPSTRAERMRSLEALAMTQSLWPAYKAVLRDKYSSNWNYILQHFDDILPIDIQNFFSTNIDPKLLYNTRG